MRTPAGVECRFYYEDYNRGRAVQECRLIARNPDSPPWRPNLCRTCPIPGILLANGCPNMVLKARVGRRLLIVPQVRVYAYCTLSEETVADPMIGCGRCHEARWEAIREGLQLDDEDDESGSPPQ